MVMLQEAYTLKDMVYARPYSTLLQLRRARFLREVRHRGHLLVPMTARIIHLCDEYAQRVRMEAVACNTVIRICYTVYLIPPVPPPWTCPPCTRPAVPQRVPPRVPRLSPACTLPLSAGIPGVVQTTPRVLLAPALISHFAASPLLRSGLHA